MSRVSFDEFCRKHGDHVVVRTGGFSRSGETLDRILFHDGAVSDTQVHEEPPTDRRALLANVEAYLEERIKQETVAWNEFRQTCLDQWSFIEAGCNVPGPPDDAEAQLIRGRQRINALKEKLYQVHKEVASFPENAEAARRAAEAQLNLERQRARMAQRVGAIRGLTL